MSIISNKAEWNVVIVSLIASRSNLNDTGVIMTLICIGNATLSAGCSTSVTITPAQGPFAIGDVLTCRADGYVETYVWANGDIVVSTTNTMTLSEGPISYTCTVEIEETGCTGSSAISGVGRGLNVEKQHTILVTVVPLMLLFITSRTKEEYMRSV